MTGGADVTTGVLLVPLYSIIMSIILYVSMFASGILLLILGRHLSNLKEKRIWIILCYVVGLITLLSGLYNFYQYLDLMLSAGSITIN